MGTCSSDLQQLRKTTRKAKKGSEQLIDRDKDSQASEDKAKEIIFTCFDRFDKNHDGLLDCHDIVELLKFTERLKSSAVSLPDFFFRDVA